MYYLALGKLSCLLNAFNNAAPRIRTNDNTVYNHLNIVLEVFPSVISSSSSLFFVNTGKLLFANLQELDVLALATQNNRRQDIA